MPVPPPSPPFFAFSAPTKTISPIHPSISLPSPDLCALLCWAMHSVFLDMMIQHQMPKVMQRLYLPSSGFAGYGGPYPLPPPALGAGYAHGFGASAWLPAWHFNSHLSGRCLDRRIPDGSDPQSSKSRRRRRELSPELCVSSTAADSRTSKKRPCLRL
uniref:Uncharacterized protein n=1 Tax=Setaria viridis TaxID=4556 RepID=A0A4U6T1Z3_SETVI|nr:hypothetical protein SEVIR_9G296500v2 [Setaria viridis]